MAEEFEVLPQRDCVFSPIDNNAQPPNRRKPSAKPATGRSDQSAALLFSVEKAECGFVLTRCVRSQTDACR